MTAQANKTFAEANKVSPSHLGDGRMGTGLGGSVTDTADGARSPREVEPPTLPGTAETPDERFDRMCPPGEET